MDPRLREDDENYREDDEIVRQDDEKYRGVLGAGPLGVGVMEGPPWTLSLLSFWSVAIESRVTEGRGCNQGDSSPLFNMAYSLSFLEWQAHSPPSQGQW